MGRSGPNVSTSRAGRRRWCGEGQDGRLVKGAVCLAAGEDHGARRDGDIDVLLDDGQLLGHRRDAIRGVWLGRARVAGVAPVGGAALDSRRRVAVGYLQAGHKR